MALPHKHTVVVPDLRGVGDSARPSGGYDSATMGDDIAELMTHLEHESYAVAGEDWGAVIPRASTSSPTGPRSTGRCSTMPSRTTRPHATS